MTSTSSCRTRRTCASTSSSRRSSVSPSRRRSPQHREVRQHDGRHDPDRPQRVLRGGPARSREERAARRVRQRLHLGRRRPPVLKDMLAPPLLDALIDRTSKKTSPAATSPPRPASTRDARAVGEAVARKPSRRLRRPRLPPRLRAPGARRRVRALVEDGAVRRDRRRPIWRVRGRRPHPPLRRAHARSTSSSA